MIISTFQLGYASPYLRFVTDGRIYSVGLIYKQMNDYDAAHSAEGEIL